MPRRSTRDTTVSLERIRHYMKLHLYAQNYAGDNASIACDKEAAIELIEALVRALANGADHEIEVASGGEPFSLPYPVEDKEQPEAIAEDTNEPDNVDEIPF